MYTFICTFICTYIYTERNISTYICIYIDTCVYAYKEKYISLYLYLSYLYNAECSPCTLIFLFWSPFFLIFPFLWRASQVDAFLSCLLLFCRLKPAFLKAQLATQYHLPLYQRLQDDNSTSLYWWSIFVFIFASPVVSFSSL